MQSMLSRLDTLEASGSKQTEDAAGDRILAGADAAGGVQAQATVQEPPSPSVDPPGGGLGPSPGGEPLKQRLEAALAELHSLTQRVASIEDRVDESCSHAAEMQTKTDTRTDALEHFFARTTESCNLSLQTVSRR